MQIEVVKGRDRDFIRAHRNDGSQTKSTFPKKGVFPHDVIHLIVESELQYRGGFWGRVHSGIDLKDVGALAMAGGHRSASRAQTPDNEIVELIQAERIVECFEAELWSQPQSSETFISILDAACAQSKVETPAVNEQNIKNVREKLETLRSDWQKLPIGESLDLSWP